MKIFHIITTIDRGGAELQILMLSKLQVSQNQNVTVIPLKGKVELMREFEDAGVQVDLGVLNKNFVAQFLKFREILKKQSPGVLHAHLPRAELLGALTTTGHITFGITRHNAESFFPKGPAFFSSFLSRWVARRTHFRIAITDAVREFCIKAKETTIELPFIVIRYSMDEYTGPLSVVKKSPKSRALIIARLVPQKNHEVLFRSISLAKGLNIRLTIVGRGPLEEHLKNLSATLGISSLIRWSGFIEDVKSELLNHDYLVLPSKYEGFGLVLLEAMQIGLPVIASDCPAIKEVLGEEYVGLFRNNDESDLVAKLHSFADHETRRAASRYLLERYELFEPNTLFRETSKAYNGSKCD